jgi:hypothetical protein
MSERYISQSDIKQKNLLLKPRKRVANPVQIVIEPALDAADIYLKHRIRECAQAAITGKIKQ